MTPLVVFIRILCKDITEKKETFIKNIRKLDSEIKTILKENDEAEGGSYNSGDSTKKSKEPNSSGTKLSSSDSEIGNDANTNDADLNSPKDISKTENEVSKSTINPLNSGAKKLKRLLKKSDDNGAGSQMQGRKESLLNDKTPNPSTKKVGDSSLNGKNSPLSSKPTDNNSNALEKDGPNLPNNNITNNNKTKDDKIEDLMGKKQASIPKKEEDPLKIKNPLGFKSLDEIKKKDVDKKVFPRINHENSKPALNPKESGAVGAEIDEIDKEMTIKRLKSENHALREQIRLNSINSINSDPTLKGNNLKKVSLEETLHGLHPQAKRQTDQKLSISSSPFFNEQLNMSKKANIARSIENKINDANNDVQNAHFLENKAVLDKKAANSLKTSANVDNIIASQIGSTSLGSKIQEDGMNDKLRAIALEKQAEEEEIKSSYFLGSALGKFETAGESAIVENSYFPNI